MAVKSSIEDRIDMEPSTGCDAISPGCENCYAERMSHRLKAMGQHKYRNGFKLTTEEPGA
jgi:protein gp37